MSKLIRTIALVGMMGSGKSAIGRKLSERLGVPLRDSDAEIEKAANSQISEIFQRDGEAFFRKREHEVIARLLSEAPCILSTGGGAFMNPANRDVITEKGVSIWLHAELETLWERVRHKNTRPLLQTDNPKATLAALLAKRDPVYALADLRIETRLSYSLDETTDKVMAVLQARPEILQPEE